MAGPALGSSQTGNVIGFGGTSMDGIHDDDSFYPFNLAAGITFADVGKAVAVDFSASNQAKLTGAGDIVLGWLVTAEARSVEGINVGTVATEGGKSLPYDTTDVTFLPVVGNSVQGSATPGLVKNMAAAQGRNNVVMAVDTVKATCVVLFL